MSKKFLEVSKNFLEIFLENSNVPESDRKFELTAAARYPQQVTDLDIPCTDVSLSAGDAAKIAQDFHETYRARYTVAEPDSDVEFVMWRLSAVGSLQAIKRQLTVKNSSSVPELEESPPFFDPTSGKEVIANLHNLESLAAQACVTGPALIVSSDTAVVIPSGSEATVAAEGHLVIDVNSA